MTGGLKTVGEVLSEQLLPCPFCGWHAWLTQHGNAYTKKRSAEVTCAGCHTKQATGAIRGTLEWCCEKAIEKWNKRISVQEGGISPSENQK